MPLLVEPDPAWAEALAETLPAGTRVLDAPPEHWGAENQGDYAIVLGPNLEIADIAALAESARAGNPAVALVLLRHEPSADTYQQAMRAGVNHVVTAADLDELADAVERSRRSFEALRGAQSTASGPAAGHGRVITVFSPKGGVGKTTVAVNLAMALSEGGARICIVDLDLAYGDVAITLQLIPEHTIAEAVGAEEDLDFQLLQTLLTKHENCSILAAPTHPEGKDRISPGLIGTTLRVLRDHFDFIVVDTAPSFDDQVLHAFDETDECIVIATLDVPTVKNVKVALETLDALDLAEGHRHLLLNRADDEVGLSPANVESLLKMKVATALPSSLAVANATNHGRPIVLSQPEHPVSRALRGLARDLRAPALNGAAKSRAGTTPLAEGDQKRRMFGRRKK